MSDGGWEQLMYDSRLFREGHTLSIKDWLQFIKEILPNAYIYIQYQHYDEDTDEDTNTQLYQII